AIDFPIGAPGLFRVATFPFENVCGVEPALQMSAAEFAFFVFFVAGALAGLLDFYFVARKLRHVPVMVVERFARHAVLRHRHKLFYREEDAVAAIGFHSFAFDVKSGSQDSAMLHSFLRHNAPRERTAASILRRSGRAKIMSRKASICGAKSPP